MTLKKSLFASLAMLALAVPVTGGAIVTFSASPAVAKGGKDKGGSDRGSRSDRGKRDKGSRGGSSSRGRSSTGGGNGNGNGNAYGAANGNGGGYGQSGQAKPVKPAKAAAVEPETMEGEVDLRPNQLGSMNGALHANINAVLAHIENGNTNGPVGALAGLAVADHEAADAEKVLETAAAFDDLDEAIANSTYGSLEEYLESGDTDDDIDMALAALDGATEADRPDEDEIIAAEDALTAQTDAEAAIFDAWNKSGEATEEEKQALLDALRERLEGDEELIAAAIGDDDDGDGSDGEGDGDGDGTGEDDSATDDSDGGDGDGSGGDDSDDETAEGTSDGDGEGEDDDGEDDGEDGEDTAALDPETQAMIDGLTF